MINKVFIPKIFKSLKTAYMSKENEMEVSELIEKEVQAIDENIVYYCKKKRDYKALMKALEEEGYMWCGGEEIFENEEHFYESNCIFLDEDKKISMSGYEYALRNYSDKIVRFKAPKKMYVLKDIYGDYYGNGEWGYSDKLEPNEASSKDNAHQFTKRTAKELKRVLGCEMEEA